MAHGALVNLVSWSTDAICGGSGTAVAQLTAISFDVSAQEIALNHGRGGSRVFGADRGASVTAMADAFVNWLRRQGNIAGVISAGGSGGASLVAPGMRALPVGVPKLIISSVASGDVGPYVGPADITIGSSRALLKATASAVSIGVAPLPSVETRITWAGPAQTSTVESMIHHKLKPKSWASAARPA